jgi:magnesium-transporting ATPase (P-type)
MSSSRKLDVEDVRESGLPSAEAADRLRRYGPNRIPEAPPPSRLELLVRQLMNPMVALLGLAAIVSLAIGERLDAGIIVAIAFANTALGYFQEGRAEGASRRLKKMMTPTARVLRDGNVRSVGAEELVPGDVIRLRAGDRVPADGNLIRDVLEVDESAVTGESLAVEKGPTSPLYAGTIITRGAGDASVTATGAETEIGRAVTSALRIPRAPTPLQSRLRRFAAFLLRAALLVCLALAGIAWAQGESLTDSILIGVSLAVAAVPEGCPQFSRLPSPWGCSAWPSAARSRSARGRRDTRLRDCHLRRQDRDDHREQDEPRPAVPCGVDIELEPRDGSHPDAIDELLSAGLLASGQLARPSDGSVALPPSPVEAASPRPRPAAASMRSSCSPRGIAVRVEPFDSERKRMSVTSNRPTVARCS